MPGLRVLQRGGRMSGRAGSSLTIHDLRKRVDGRRGPNGRRLCGWCYAEVPKGCRSWCGQKCVDEYLIQASPSRFRSVVFKRDRGVCALCRTDTRENYHRWCEQRETMRQHLFRPPGECQWEADHIRAICEGGDDTLENARTLCLACHRQETGKLRRERAARRRAQRPLPLEQSL